MSNFDFLLEQKDFESFASVAVRAEKYAHDDPDTSIGLSRKAAEYATNWLYAVDRHLDATNRKDFVSKICNFEFKKLVGTDLCNSVHAIRKIGNKAVHDANAHFAPNIALAILDSLFKYLCWIEHNYISADTFRRFSSAFVPGFSSNTSQNIATTTISKPPVQNQFDSERKAVRVFVEKDGDDPVITYSDEKIKELNNNKEKNQDKPLNTSSDISEEFTRKLYIDTLLNEVGWFEGKNMTYEYQIEGVQFNDGESGKIDYVLWDGDGKPLAIIEAKRYKEDAHKGKKQAQTYAKCLEDKFHVKPYIYLTNGHEIFLENDGDNNYHERPVGGFFTKDDMHSRMFNFERRLPFDDIDVSDICGRYYQIEAVKAACNRFSNHFRKALLVMATGSGKTRTIFGLIKSLAERNWVKNVLFLADRTALVSQAYGECKKILKGFPAANLCATKKEDRDLNARLVFSTYQTMISTIDSAKNNDGYKLFSPGHFDLLICDEAHRSIYNKYREIFDYFDSMLVGLTATPKDEVDKNTYAIFDLEKGDPTYYYSLDQAVKDEYLVNFKTYKLKTAIMTRGIKYNELSEEDKRAYEEQFAKLDEDMVTDISSSSIDRWLFNEDTIKLVIDALMDKGLKVDSGNKLGKTIIFARNHAHAKEIIRIFYKMYPGFSNEFMQEVGSAIKWSEGTIDNFKKPDSYPQVVVSVDMMDTGIDVPECLNLVFYKPVYSKAKFWQMIGRGTRKCPELIDGEDKQYFLIIDPCSNFDFFSENPNGFEGVNQITLEHHIFKTRLKIVKALQNAQGIEADEYIKATIKELVDKVKNIPTKDSFRAQHHIRAIEDFCKDESYQNLTDEQIQRDSDEVGPLLLAKLDGDNISAQRFDRLMYNIQEMYLTENAPKLKLYINRLKKITESLLDIANSIPDIAKKQKLLEFILEDDFVEKITLQRLEQIRNEIREIAKFAQSDGGKPVYIALTDDIEEEIFDETGVAGMVHEEEFEPYAKRVQKYVRAHLNDGVIGKIHTNQQLSFDDIQALKDIVWKELGSKEEYENAFKDQDLGVLIRKTAGLDRQAANDAFAKFLTEHNLNAQQSAFVKLVIDYIVSNGLILERKILMNAPFDTIPVSRVFNDMNLFSSFLNTIDSIKGNAVLNVN